jgi:CO dehydrogenase/acetyl-CoA synthase gamma subunit (corrinoid Fe-S protein)
MIFLKKNKDQLKQYKAGTLKEFTLGSGELTRSIECDGVWYERETVRQFILKQYQKPKFVFHAIEDALKASNDNKCILNILNILSEGKGKQLKFALQNQRVIFSNSNKCNFLKNSKLVKFNQITLLNLNATKREKHFLAQNP